MATTALDANISGKIEVISTNDPAKVAVSTDITNTIPTNLSAADRSSLLAAVNARISQVNSLLTSIDNQIKYIAVVRPTYTYKIYESTNAFVSNVKDSTTVSTTLSNIIPGVVSVIDPVPALQRMYNHTVLNFDISSDTLKNEYDTLSISLMQLTYLKDQLSQ